MRTRDFVGGHVFTYSERPGTAAARMPHPVPHRLRKECNARIRAVLQKSAAYYRRRFLGWTRTVLWEAASTLGPQVWTFTGLTDNYLRVQALAPESLWNRLTPVRLNAETEGGVLVGEMVSGQPEFT